MNHETSTTPIPFVDLLAQHAEIADEVDQGFAGVLASGAFVGGPDVHEFETEFGAYCGVRHCIGVGNGTDAIELGLRAAGIGFGDEVVVPANTFIATAEAVARTGASLVLVDCDEATMLIDPLALPAALSPKTRAVIGVDLYGQIAPFEAISAAVGDDVLVVEDAAQSQGATRHGRGIGSGVAFASTSFYPGKNLGAYGDAGAVLTNDEVLAEDVRAIGNHGGTRKYEHRLIGANSRLDTLQAVVLRAKLRRLDSWNTARRRVAERYREAFSKHPSVIQPAVAEGNVPVWHLYPDRVADQQVVIDRLTAAGVGCGIHYPMPVHLTQAFSYLGLPDGAFPNAERASQTMVSLPMHPHLSAEQQDRVVQLVLEALS
jgi:dTDP-4-amino-4,6-dideoxygalactose transaminase